MLASPSHEPGPGWLGVPAGNGVRHETRLARGLRGSAPYVVACVSTITAGPGRKRRSGSAVAMTRQRYGT